jgi:CelD/BcsL family acetyltransferase involved in cellulose biosynthesis
MTDEDRIDARLTSLLAVPDRPPDEAFVARIERMVLAEQLATAARRAAWRRFVVESLASAAIVVAFCLVWRLSPTDLPLDQLPVAPAGAAMLVIFLWFGLELRPAATGR